MPLCSNDYCRIWFKWNKSVDQSRGEISIRWQLQRILKVTCATEKQANQINPEWNIKEASLFVIILDKAGLI